MIIKLSRFTTSKMDIKISKTFHRRGIFYFKDFSSIDTKLLPTNTPFVCTIHLNFSLPLNLQVIYTANIILGNTLKFISFILKFSKNEFPRIPAATRGIHLVPKNSMHTTFSLHLELRIIKFHVSTVDNKLPLPHRHN